MPTGEIGHLRAALSANYAAFESDMGKAREAVRKNAEGMSGAMSKVGRSFEDVMGKLVRFSAMAGAATVGALAAMIGKQIQLADRLDEIAQKTGTTTEFLSSMRIALKTSSIETEQFAKGIESLSKNMRGSGEDAAASNDAFRLLGVEIKKNDGTLRNSEEVFKDLADKFAALPDGAEKTALAMKLFGKAGADMIPVLNLGSAGLAEMQAKAESLGLVISTETAKQAAYLADQLTELKMKGDGLALTIGMKIVPWLNELTDRFSEAAKKGGILAGVWAAVKGAWVTLNDAAEKQAITRNFVQATDALERFYKQPIQLGFVEKQLKKRVEETKAAYNAMIAEENRKEKAEKDAMQASLNRQKAEKEAREKNLAAMVSSEGARKKVDLAKTKADEAEKRRQASINNQIEALQKQADTYGMTSDEIAIYTLQQLGANKAQIEAAKIALDNVAAKKMQAEEEQAIQEELKKTADAAQKLYEDTRTPQEKSIEETERINKLYLEGAISADTYSRAVKKVWEGIDTKETAEKFDELQRSIEGWGHDSANAIVDFCTGTKGAFTDLIDSIIKDILRMLVYRNITGPLFGGISEMAGGNGGGGWLGTALGFGASILGGAVGEGGFSLLPSDTTIPVAAGTKGASSTAAMGSIFPEFQAMKFDTGGWIQEPVLGRGLSSGRYYSFAENEAERVMTKRDLGAVSNKETSAPKPTLNARIINVLDPSIVGNYLATDAGEQIIMNIVKRNQRALGVY